MLRTTLPELLKEGLLKVFFREFDRETNVYQRIANTRTSNKAQEVVYGVSGITNLSPKAESSPFVTDQLYDDPKVTFTHQAFGKEIPLSHETTEDDLYRVIEGLPEALARAAKRTLDTYFADVFNNGFTTEGAGFTTGGDGKPLFATDHPLLGGAGTASNRLSTPAALTVTTFAEACLLLRTTKNYRGEPLDLTPKFLLFPAVASMATTAFEILKSSGRPDTADRADNWASRQGIEPVDPNGWVRLNADFGGDDDAWFLLTDKEDHHLVLMMREPPSLDVGEDKHTKDIFHTVYLRFSVGAENWRGVVGSPGV